MEIEQPTIKTAGAPSTAQETTAEVRPVAAEVAQDQQQQMTGIENRLQKMADGSAAIEELEKDEVK